MMLVIGAGDAIAYAGFRVGDVVFLVEDAPSLFRRGT
jgi:hypothetical protein